MAALSALDPHRWFGIRRSISLDSRDRSGSHKSKACPSFSSLTHSAFLRSAPAPSPSPSPLSGRRSLVPTSRRRATLLHRPTNRSPMLPGPPLMPLHGAAVGPAGLAAAVSPESRSWGPVLQDSLFQRSQANRISFKREVSTKATLRSVRCNAAQTQTQSVQRKSSTATVKRSDPKGKLQGPKLDDGSGGFPPFRFGKGGGGGGGGGGGSNYFGGFLLFTIVLLMDYLKEFEKNLAARRHTAGDDDASSGLLE